ncbi:TetR/AcrR family transcriptional regulator [Neptuniibacter halophilus]|uniref:TetR/AcrR family transcriptional regulator n=1 Tax=Neptuniibacter halophilus TaxID=651666 RepID=UPI0025745F8D|nr:TetR/AcrR family transcriptional regulator [Neptuniibacter halophilus]
MTLNQSVTATESGSSVRKPQKRGLKSAKKMLDAAAFLFVKKGFDGTSVDDIVERAGTAKGTFYHHYESKLLLLNVLREQTMEDYQTKVNVAFSSVPEDDFVGRLDTWVKVCCDAYLEIGALHDVIFRNFPESRWTLSHLQFMENFRCLLERGHDSGVWFVTSPYVTANFIYRGMIGAIDDLIIGQKPLSNLNSELVKLVHSILKVKEKSM